MTRNDSDADGIWMKTDDGKSHRAQRQPMNWPTAAFGLGVVALLAFAAWVCGGVATEWISR
ncbi:MAG TPA: hypothetical protein VGW74_11820 [Propionibacteriaceae bacterium]|nr:hypothetical protein [Propionibacteriaceae bacterium]